MIKLALKILLTGLIALLMPLLVHAEELETKEETKIEEKESILENTKSVNPDDPTESCNDIINNNLKIGIKDHNLYSDGTPIPNGSFDISTYIRVNNNSDITINRNFVNNLRYCLYDSNYNILGCYNYGNDYSFIINTNNANYVRFTIMKDKTFEIRYTYCVNMEEETMIQTQNLVKLGVVGVGLLIAIFLTRRN